MYRSMTVSIVIPAYNEELLIRRTLEGIPAFVDHIVVVNDKSTDATLSVLSDIDTEHPNMRILSNRVNLGIGGSLKAGFSYIIENTTSSAIGIVPGDNQFDCSFLQPMLDELIDEKLDYVKACRFFDREALKTMPTYRRLGNILISLLTKFSTGYYSLTDITDTCGWLRRSTLERVNFALVRERYDFEVSFLTALSIVGGKVKDHSTPAYYGEETSNINLFGTILRNLRAVWVGFWQRIYFKYVLFSFHPIALLLLSGLLASTIGAGFGIFILIVKITQDLSPSTGTVMLAVLPLVLGFQLLLTALIMDASNEGK